MNLTQFSNVVTGVISLGQYLNDLDVITSRLERYLKKNANQYYFILHDMDYKSEYEKKTLHLHYVARMKNRKRLVTFLNEISNALSIDTLAISIEKARDIDLCIRYLVHKDDIDKFQYNYDDVITNDQNFLNVLINDFVEYDTQTLIDICKACQSYADVIKELPQKVYMKNRNLIRDIWANRWDM